MLQLTDIKLSRALLMKWLLIIFMIKAAWFSFFIVFRDKNWFSEFVVKGIAIRGGDSVTYYYPIEKYINEGEYRGMCRMPGLMPVYLPLRWMMSEDSALVVMVFIQLAMDILTTLLLAIIAARVFGSAQHFKWTALLAAISTFVSIRSNYLLSDSLCISSFIISIYFLTNYCIKAKWKWLLLSGLFLAWCLFLRPVMLIAIPFTALVLLYHHRRFFTALKSGIILLLPVGLLLSIWTMRNMSVFGRAVIFVAPIEECMGQITPEFNAIRGLIITMGEDFQPWSKGSAAEWFIQKKSKHLEESPFSEKDFTTAYNLDSLNQLRMDYVLFTQEKNDSVRSVIGLDIQTRANHFTQTYKQEHAVRYWLINRLGFIRIFMFPSRIDDLPLPAVSEMNILQKLAKAGSYVLLLFVSACSILSLLWFTWKRNWLAVLWALLPFSFIIILGYLGFIEQRYLATAYPFMVMITCGFLISLTQVFLKKKA
jgi:hypothetical protein